MKRAILMLAVAPREESPPSVGTFAESGRFEIRGLEPGSYTVRVFLNPGRREFIRGIATAELEEGGHGRGRGSTARTVSEVRA